MKIKRLVVILLVGAVLGLGLFVFRAVRASNRRGNTVMSFIYNSSLNPELVIHAGTKCGDAPFIFPTTGMAGYIWDDSFRPGHRHQGVDIFAGTDVGVTPVIAAYPGYLTRQGDWRSSVIIRVPSDPLVPGRQIWVYYTHMADEDGNSFIAADFPPGTSEKYVEAGTFLGYQGDFSGTPGSPVGVHLHISVVKDDSGHYLNELDINNTYDPSPYLGLALNANFSDGEVPVCEKDATTVP